MLILGNDMLDLAPNNAGALEKSQGVQIASSIILRAGRKNGATARRAYSRRVSIQRLR
jgi:hypothetical protein